MHPTTQHETSVSPVDSQPLCQLSASICMQREAVANLEGPGDLWVMHGRVIYDDEDQLYLCRAASESQARARFKTHMEAEFDLTPNAEDEAVLIINIVRAGVMS